MKLADPDKKQRLLDRLEEIAESLVRNDYALALVGLGSVGQATSRLDAYSDLDIFVIVEDGYGSFFIKDLEWLSSICPLAYSFKDSDHSYKLLFEDGIFCEVAVFDRSELKNIPYTDARVIWARDPDFVTSLPGNNKLPPGGQPKIERLVGEALTNLYVGLGRYRRGEKLNASRFIQGYAMDRIIELSGFIEPDNHGDRDPFSKTRRYEQRFPNLAQELPRFSQGYERSIESALAILDFLDRHFEVNGAMREAILALAKEDDDKG